ncbi:molybdate ABC transporter substrate-binding protein [Allopusillimonas ginsengisoli]|uniref:molybdate ABC transporter substrate-binding protein n=1 Tax=Allopusillimonas ginsengisoli TaxID=453575 RepID=UPI00101F4E0B|nr:molybdate ABC transporter substrate-binding protein [Allopusillimonas ginsengisoli]TEA79930.1 molybdate ABC transporter substrate-binding protein [Allopusillimonas ginsengisoli]
MMTKKWLAAAIFAAMGLHGQASAEDLVVAAASSLTNAFTEIGEQFQKDNPGAKVLNTFSASGKLAAQVVEGAPIDVFASADQKAMDKALDGGSIDAASRKDFVRNQVVLIVPAQDPLNIKSVKDLGSDKVTRVAFGNPASVPVGRYTQASLEQSGDWAGVEKRQVLGQNVRQVLDYVARGEVDAGFVFATDAAIKPDEVKVVQKLESPVPVLYPIALVKRGGRSSLAGKYLDFIHSDQGQEILAKYGFDKP